MFTFIFAILFPFVIGYVFGLNDDPALQFVEDAHDYDEVLGI